MKTFPIQFRNVDDIIEFVKLVNSCEGYVDLKSGSHIVDAKSLVSVMALAQSKNLQVVFHENENYEQLEKILTIA